MDARKAFDQCAFPCAVFSEERVYLSSSEGKVNFIESFHSWELYFNAFHFKQAMFRQLNSSLKDKGGRL